MNNKVAMLCLLVFFGCTTNLEIGGNRHHFGRVPQNVIWFQVAGLSATQIPLARYTSQPIQSSFYETAICSGQTYDASYKYLRPKASEFFNSQTLSSKLVSANICEEFSSKIPIWRVFQEEKRKVSILEIGATPSNSLQRLRDCKPSYMEDEAIVLRRAPDRAFSDQLFDVEKNKPLSKGFYYEKNCDVSGNCKASQFETIKYFLKNSFKPGKINFMQIRDYSFKNLVLSKSTKKMKSYIQELTGIIDWARTNSNHREKTLILVTGAEPIGVNFPKRGFNWISFEKNGLGLAYNKSELMSPVFSWGPSSELFCGVMDNIEISKRIYNRFFQKSFKFDSLIESIKNR